MLESGGKMKRSLFFITIIMIFIILFSCFGSIYAATPTLNDSEITKNEGVINKQEDKSAVNDQEILFEGEPDSSTGNSAGEIAFMLIFFLICVFFVVEGVVSFIIKRKKEKTDIIDASIDDRRR